MINLFKGFHGGALVGALYWGLYGSFIGALGAALYGALAVAYVEPFNVVFLTAMARTPTGAFIGFVAWAIFGLWDERKDPPLREVIKASRMRRGDGGKSDKIGL